jgi:DNA-binding transcriptional ArsR family regulator
MGPRLSRACAGTPRSCDGDEPAAVEQPHNRGWTFITHHAQVLLAIARDPDVRVTEIASAAGITERYAYRVLSDLQRAGYVRRSRRGRRNLYELNAEAPLGDPVVEEESLRQLLWLSGRGERGDLLEALASRRDADSSLARSQDGDA